MSRPIVHRNAPCPCGSGKKYKNCCRKDMDVDKEDGPLTNPFLGERQPIDLPLAPRVPGRLVTGGAPPTPAAHPAVQSPP